MNREAVPKIRLVIATTTEDEIEKEHEGLSINCQLVRARTRKLGLSLLGNPNSKLVYQLATSPFVTKSPHAMNSTICWSSEDIYIF